MSAGLALRKNLLCVSFTSARGQVFLFDLEERRLISQWRFDESEERFSDAGGVAIHEGFQIFVADTLNHSVRRFNAFGKEIGRLGKPWTADMTAARRDRPGVLDSPRDVAVFGDSVFVVCGERRRRRGLQRFHVDGALEGTYPSRGDSEAEYGAPRGVWVGKEGVFVADTLRGCIQRFRLSGAFVNEFGTDAGLRSTEVSRPVNIAVVRLGDADRVVVLDDGDRPGLVMFSSNGERLELPRSLLSLLDDPVALATDEAGRLWLLDRAGVRVLRCDLKLRTAETVVDLEESL